MRTQATKTQPKKSAPVKTSFKQQASTKQVKKKQSPIKNIKKAAKKAVDKNIKKKISKPDKNDPEDDSKTKCEKPETSTEAEKSPRSDSPSKKNKTEKVEKKIETKKTAALSTKKKPAKQTLKDAQSNSDSESYQSESGDEVKYRLNLDHAKFQKTKTIKKTNAGSSPKKTVSSSEKVEKTTGQIDNKSDSEVSSTKSSTSEMLLSQEKCVITEDSRNVQTVTDKHQIKPTASTSTNNSAVASQKSKQENERPPKFFTSTRSPRVVDIDLKSCKTTKTNVTLTEKFSVMKTPDNKSQNNAITKENSGSVTSKESEIDVYTFTDYKVDSPKSVLPDFRSPIGKNDGRVRPIARVKGTIIDKSKGEADKKKYSLHRPIEDVVKQLKAGKRAEESRLLDLLTSDDSTKGILVTATNESVTEQTSDFNLDDKPRNIISKSYKMVARKSIIPGSITSTDTLPSKVIVNTKQTDAEKSKKPSKKKSKSLKPHKTSNVKKLKEKIKKTSGKSRITDDDIDSSTFSLNTSSTSQAYSSSDESESNDDTKESSDSEYIKIIQKKLENSPKKGKNLRDSDKKNKSKDLEDLSPDSLIDLKETSSLMKDDIPNERRLKLLSMWTGPKKHRMASLNALAKVHCLYENESRSHSELGLMKTIERTLPIQAKSQPPKKKSQKQEKRESTSESEYEKKDKMVLESSEEDAPTPVTRNLRVVPGARGSGKYWDHKSSTSSSEESEADCRKKTQPAEKKKPPAKKPISNKSDTDKPPAKIKKTTGAPIKKKRNKNEIVMDLKDMVVQKRMASLNATAILAASYEKRSPKSSKDESTTSDSNSDKDETYANSPKNGVATGVKSEAGIKMDECKSECKKEGDSSPPKQKVEVIVNQDTDVTITGVYSTNREGFCTFSGVKYRISSTSHTQTTATASSEKETCSHEDPRYTPLNALTSMQPRPVESAESLPAVHPHPHPGHEPGAGLGRRPGCSSAFTAPPPSHHEPGYYQPAGPLIKEGAADERAVARYPPHHYHPHAHPPPPMLQHYGPPYYPDLCYGRYYQRPPGYLPPPQPQPETQIGEPYPPPPQYYPGSPCYHNTHQRVPYMEYRGCSCPMNSCPKNVLIGPATGKPPNSGGPGDIAPVAAAPPGGAFRAKARAAREPDVAAKESEPPPGRYQPPAHPPPFSGVSPKREICDEFRVSTDSIGPPSPARGSAGACAPQPPPAPPPRRARVGKAMLRQMLIGESTAALISAKPSPPPENDDVIVVSPPDVQCIPIDLSSSDETEKRDEPHDRLLADVKKENEGPEGGHTVRKTAPVTETQALREHNSPCVPPPLDPSKPEPPKQPTKRRYSRPKLEVEPNLELVDGRSTNGIGEHVKLQKRRKLVPESEITPDKCTDVDSKKKSPAKKRVAKEPEPKRCNKRKSSIGAYVPPLKRIELEQIIIPENIDARLQNPAAVCTKPKIKSALLLDKLIRKNSVDRESIDLEPDPSELFLTSTPPVPSLGSQKLLNINNNVVGEKVPITDTRPKKSVPSIADKILAKLAEGKQEQKKLNTKAPVKQAKSLSKPLSSKNNLKIQVVDKPKPKTEDKLNKINATENKTKDILKDDLTSPSKATSDVPMNSQSTAPSEPSHDKCIDKSESKNTANKTEAVKPLEKPKLISQKSEVKSEKSQKLAKSDSESEKKCLKSNEKFSKLLCSKSDAKVSEVEAVDVMEDVCTVVAVPAPAKRAGCRRLSAGKRRRLKLGAAAAGATVDDLPVPRSQPKWSNGWMWEGQPFVAKIYSNNDVRADALRRCYGGMVHRGGDRVRRGDCVLLRAAARRGPEQPYVARVAHLWENPDDGEMMVSLVWYYRPEHTELARQPDDAPDEVFASRHRDVNSVACIEDKCYVLTFNEYCRYRKRLKAAEEGVRPGPCIVPPMPASDVPLSVTPADSRLPPNVSPELVLFCRKIYDFRSKKIQVPNK